MWPAWLILGFLALFVFAAMCQRILDNPRGDVETGLFWHAIRLYARVFHGLRVEGVEHIPTSYDAGPLIIVANHTGAVDPLLIQAACRFEIRFVMAADMRAPKGEWFWSWSRVIFVDRDSGDVAGAREAVRHVKDGHVLGIFPEGGIERPPRTIIPFMPGVGFIIRRTGAPVLPVVVEGTPPIDTAWVSLVKPSPRPGARLRFMPPIDYSKAKMAPQDIAEDLRHRFAAWTGWPFGDRRPPRGPYAKRKDPEA